MPAPSTPVTGGATERRIKSDLKYDVTAVIADNQNLKAGTLLSLNSTNEVQTATNGEIIEGVSKTELSVDTNTYNKKAVYRQANAEDTYDFTVGTGTIASTDIGKYFAFDANHEVDASDAKFTWDLTRQLQLVEVFSTTKGTFRIVTNPVQGTELKRTVKIETADVLTLNATPVTLVPAPGAGKAIVVERIVGTIDYNSAAYATNVTLEFRYTDASGTKVSADAGTLLNATADKFITVNGIEAILVLTANAPVVVTVATGDPANGDSPVWFQVFYRVVDL